jgi:hypothetical protein
VLAYLSYTLSLPERALRSGSGVVGGTLRESAALLVPSAFQSSKTYSVLVRQMLDFLAEDMGGVEKPAAGQAGCGRVENFVARKTVGNFVEMAGLATLHVSPLTILAVVSDLAYGSREYLRELSDELKRQGVIDSDSTIDGVQSLLDAVGRASQVTATALDTPPVSLEGLKDTVEQTRAALRAIDPVRVVPQAEVARLWGEFRELASRERVDLVQLSGAVTLGSLDKAGLVGKGALSGLRVAGNLLDRHVLKHYAGALENLRRKGLYASLAETSGPYVDAVWRNFSPARKTWTERLLTGKWWEALRARWSKTAHSDA